MTLGFLFFDNMFPAGIFPTAEFRLSRPTEQTHFECACRFVIVLKNER